MSRIEQIIEFERQADQHAEDRQRCRWEASRLIWEQLNVRRQSGRELAKEIGKEHAHVIFMARVWQEHGTTYQQGGYHGNHSFDSLYQQAKRAQSETVESVETPRPGVPNPTGKNGRPRVGDRTVKQALNSLREAAIQLDATAESFDSGVFGDIEALITVPESSEWFDLLIRAHRRIGGHLRAVKRHREGRIVAWPLTPGSEPQSTPR